VIKIDAATISKQVVRALRQQIFSGCLKPGEKVLEAKFAAEMGISRGPVREALLILEQEGLVENSPRKGARVVKITLDDIREIYTLRALLEGAAVVLFMENKDAVALNELEDALKALSQTAAGRDVIEIAKKNLQFHEVILANCGNKRFMAVWKSLQAQSRMFSSMTTEYYLEIEDLYQHHVELKEAIYSGDKKTARLCFEKHILDSMEQLIESLKKNSFL
jgi:DNA-binding GntR family transcriptional regulator